MAVAARNFPGAGDADRLPEDEVATVRKSIEELKNFDLAPFFAVTGSAPSTTATVDALVTAPIRYQGFQGNNIRPTTRPVSFDSQALSLLLNLPALASWRSSGGIMISDNLGSQAVRRFYELTSQTFDAPRVALNAFLAGNDLLYLGDITAGEDPDTYATTLRILEAFTNKYRDDPVFAQRVDESVLRILRLKIKLYPQFDLQTVLPPLDGLLQVGISSQVSFEVARDAATLISPSPEELDNALPDPPAQNERLLFFSDVHTAQQCSACPGKATPEVDAFQEAVIRLYGRQVVDSNLSSYSFEQLAKWLDGSKEIPRLETDLRRANWIIFSTQNVTGEMPSSRALKRLLAEKPSLLQSKRLVVFAFNAPYYLDATEISKITAYYGLYSKAPRFIEVAARLLFREIQPQGASPVSVSGAGYDLFRATQPNASLVIPLSVDLPAEAPVEGTATPIPVPEYKIGEMIPLRARGDPGQQRQPGARWHRGAVHPELGRLGGAIDPDCDHNRGHRPHNRAGDQRRAARDPRLPPSRQHNPISCASTSPRERACPPAPRPPWNPVSRRCPARPPPSCPPRWNRRRGRTPICPAWMTGWQPWRWRSPQRSAFTACALHWGKSGWECAAASWR